MTLIAITCMHSHKDQRSSLSDNYIEAVEKAGGTPVILPPSLSPEASARALQHMDGLLLSGGPDMSPLVFGQQPHPDLRAIDPYRDEQETALVQEAQKLGLPMLGICRGLQVINVVLGGTIVQHIDTRGENTIQHRQNAPGWYRHHHVSVKAGTILAGATGEGELVVNSFHHQAVDKVAPGLAVSAVAPDGIVEALESVSPWILGVQWHPEMMWRVSPEALKVFAVFIAACGGVKA